MKKWVSLILAAVFVGYSPSSLPGGSGGRLMPYAMALAPSSKASDVLEEKAIEDLARMVSAKAGGQRDDGYLQAEFLYAIATSPALSYIRQDRLFVRGGALYVALRTGARLACVRFRSESESVQDGLQPLSRRVIKSAGSLPSVVAETLCQDDFDRMDRGKPAGMPAGGIQGPGFVTRPPGAAASAPADTSFEEFLKLYEAESARYLALIQRAGRVEGEAIIRVLKQYFLIYLIRDRESARQNAILAQFKTRNLLTAREVEAIQGHLHSPPHEALSALAVLPPASNISSVESIYSLWLMGMFETVPVPVKLQKELADAIREDRILVKHGEIAVPLVVMFDGIWPRLQDWMDVFLGSDAPHKIESITNKEVQEACRKDMDNYLRRLKFDAHAGYSRLHYYDYMIGRDAQAIIRHITFPGQDALIVDLGSSTGRFLAEVARRQRVGGLPSGNRLLAVDANRKDVNAGKSLREAEGLDEVGFHAGDATNLADVVKDGQADVVTMTKLMNDLHDVNDKKKILDLVCEVDRMLKVDGELHIADEGNTPAISYALWSKLGYEIIKREKIPGVQSRDDYLLLSFRKKRAALSRQESRKLLENVPIPEPMRSYSNTPASAEIWKLLDASIPQPGRAATGGAAGMGAQSAASASPVAPENLLIGPLENPATEMPAVLALLKAGYPKGKVWQAAVERLEKGFAEDPGGFLVKNSIRVARNRETGAIVGAAVYASSINVEEEMDLVLKGVQTPVAHLEMMAAQSAGDPTGICEHLARAVERELENMGIRCVTTSVIPGAAGDSGHTPELFAKLGYQPVRKSPFLMAKTLAPRRLPSGRGMGGSLPAVSADLKSIFLRIEALLKADPKEYQSMLRMAGRRNKVHLHVFNEHFQSLLPGLPWETLEALARMDPTSRALATGLDAEAADLVLMLYIRYEASQKGIDKEEADAILLGRRDALSADETMVRDLLVQTKNSGQVGYDAPPSGLVIVTEIGGAVLPDPRQRYGSAHARFKDRYSIAGSSVLENKPVPTNEGTVFANPFRAFYALYKKGSPDDADWIGPKEDVFQRQQESLREITGRKGEEAEEEFYCSDATVRIDGRLSTIEGHQCSVYHYGDYSFLIPHFLRDAQGEIVRTGMPVYLLENSLEEAVRPVTGKLFKVKVRRLAKEDQKAVKKILANAPRERLSICPVEGDSGLVTPQEWSSFLVRKDYQAKKRLTDGYILREIEIFLGNKTKEQIEALKILDAGAGQGTLMRRIRTLITMLRPDVDAGKVHIVGIEPNMALRTAARANGLDVRAGDIRRIPFPDDHFDILIAQSVVARGVLSEADGEKAMKELYRVAKSMHPGGTYGEGFIMRPGGVAGGTSPAGGERLHHPPMRGLLDNPFDEQPGRANADYRYAHHHPGGPAQPARETLTESGLQDSRASLAQMKEESDALYRATSALVGEINMVDSSSASEELMQERSKVGMTRSDLGNEKMLIDRQFTGLRGVYDEGLIKARRSRPDLAVIEKILANQRKTHDRLAKALKKPRWRYEARTDNSRPLVEKFFGRERLVVPIVKTQEPAEEVLFSMPAGSDDIQTSLARVGREAARAGTDRIPYPALLFDGKKAMDAALAELSELAQRDPNLLEMDAENRAVTLLRFAGRPKIFFLYNSPEIQGRVPKVASMEPLHHPFFVHKIAERRSETGEDYFDASRIVYLKHLGLPEQKAKSHFNELPKNLLFDRAFHPSLRLLLKHLTPEMARPLLEGDSLRKAKALDTMVAAGVTPYNAREIVLMEGSTPYEPADLEVLKQITLQAQEAQAKDLKEAPLSLKESDTAAQFLAGIARRHPGINFDPVHGFLVVSWLRSTEGQLYARPVRMTLRSAGDTQSLARAFPLTAAEEQAIWEEIKSPSNKRTVLDESKNRIKAIREKKAIFFFDASGKTVDVYHGELGDAFNRRLETLLRRCGGDIWAEGIRFYENGWLPTQTPHITRPNAFQHNDALASVRDGNLAVLFTKGCEGKTLDTRFAKIADFEKALRSPPSEGPFLSDKKTVQQPLLYVEEDGKLEPWDTLPPAIANSTEIWKMWEEAGGRPIVMTHRTTTSIGQFSFLFSMHAGDRAGFDPKNKPVEWRLSAKRDGIEIRAIHQKDMQWKKRKPRVFVFNIPLPENITSVHPYFKNQTEYLIADTRELKRGGYNEATTREMKFIMEDLEETLGKRLENTPLAGIMSVSAWETGVVKEAARPPMERLKEILQRFGRSHHRASKYRVGGGLIIFYTSAGKPFDYFEGGCQADDFKKKFNEILAKRESFWVGGLRLNGKQQVHNFLKDETISYKERGFAKDPVVAWRIRRGPQNSYLIMDTISFRGLGAFIKQGALKKPMTAIPSIRAYVLDRARKVPMLVDAHPTKVRAASLKQKLKGIPAGDLFLVGVVGAESKKNRRSPTVYLSGEPAFPFEDVGGLPLWIKIDRKDFTVKDYGPLSDIADSSKRILPADETSVSEILERAL